MVALQRPSPSDTDQPYGRKSEQSHCLLARIVLCIAGLHEVVFLYLLVIIRWGFFLCGRSTLGPDSRIFELPVSLTRANLSLHKERVPGDLAFR